MASGTFRTVRFQGHRSLGRVHKLLQQVKDATTHEERGRALDEAIKVFERLYDAAAAQRSRA